MEIEKTEIDGVIIITPSIYTDDRGYFFESFSYREFNKKAVPAIGHAVKFVQDNESMSTYGVARGLHYQKMPYAQSKLVRVVKGTVIDIAVDIRKGSKTYGKHVAVKLSADNHKQLFIPRGFAHGFIVLSDVAVFQYKCDNYYHPESEAGINMLDPALKIDLKIDPADLIFASKDTQYPLLADIMTDFSITDALY